MNVENVILRGIFETALKHDHIKQHQLPNIPKVKQSKDLTKRRSAFSKLEYEKLTEFLFDWWDVDADKNMYSDELEGRLNIRREENKLRRWLLRNYVLFLFHSGLRPGTETDNLQWKHVQLIRNSKGDTRIKLTVQGKRGLRYPVISPAAASALNQIRMDNQKGGKFPDGDQYVFTLKNGKRVKNDYFRQLFRKALEECGLLEDDIGRQRSLYCLRHSYATNQLIYQKVSIYTLAEQMGTSVQMIERHYGHLTPELAVDELTNGSVDDEYDMAAWEAREEERQNVVKDVPS
jgi:integrase